MKSPRRVLETAIPAGSALLPTVPYQSREQVPSLMTMRRANEKLRRLMSYLHLAALVTAAGPVPKDILIEEVILQRAGNEPDEPRLLATWMGKDYGSLVWFETFEHGLDRWDEGGFEDPIQIAGYVHDGQQGHVISIGDYDSLIQHNLNGLKVRKDLRGYDNLKGLRFRPISIV